jgi:purine catabolism regulator
LAQLSLENRGLPAIAQALRQMTGKSVIIQDERYDIQALTLSGDCLLTETEVRALMTDRAPQRHWDLQPPLDDKSPPCSDFPLTAAGTCSVAAIVTDGRVRGYLSLLGPAEGPDPLDRLAAERGALVCAFEFAKQHVVAVTEQRLRGDFLDALLAGKPADDAALTRHATELGYPLERHHAVVLLAAAGDSSRALSLLGGELHAALAEAGLHIFMCPHEAQLAVLCNAENPARLQGLRGALQTARLRVAELAPGSHIAGGLGRPGSGLAGLRRSFAQAEESLMLAQTLFNGDRVLSFGELRLYHLLCRLRGSEELNDFSMQTLGPLVAYDATHDTQFIPTLEAFFAHHGNVSQTAESLYLHRNSLLYRLERIRDIAALDLDVADDRFALQLALKLRPLVDKPGCHTP